MRNSPVVRVALVVAATIATFACGADRVSRPKPQSLSADDVPAAIPRLFITEIMPDPTKVADAAGEWFEIFNAGTDPVDLNGYKITSGPTGSETHTIASSVVVPGIGFVVLGNNANSATNGGVTEAYSYGTSITLNNSNTDWLTIKMPDGTLVDSIAYAVRAADGTPGAFSPPSGASRAVIEINVDHTIVAGSNWKTSPATETYGLGDRGTPGSGPYGPVTPPGPVVTVSVTPSPASVALDATKQLTATGLDDQGHTSPTTFTWESATPAIATVDATGKVTGIALGTTTITATSANSIAGSTTLTVTEANGVASISIGINTPASAPVNFTKPAFATVRDANNVVISPQPHLTWSSSDPAIATVDSLGYITGVAPGSVTIRATAANGVFGSASFTTEAGDAATTAIYRNHLEFGTPTDASPADELILTKRQYVLSYNKNRGGPNWVSWDLNATQFGPAPRCDCFSSDQTLPGDVYHVVDFDYRNGGYDRGHMVQSESRTTTAQENAATFLLTNILPQAAENNQGPWSQFENFLNDLVRTGGKEVYVIAGGEFAANPPTLKNEGKVAIPDYTFKIAVILPAGQGLASVHSVSDLQVIAVVMPNRIEAGGPASAVGIRNTPWQTFQTTVDKIEAATGYDFLDKLPDDIERLVESGDRAPVAAAGGPYSANEGSAVSFDGSHSSDPDVGDVLTYAWNFGDGSSGSGATPSHVYGDNGTYTATLTVSDPVGASSVSTATVTIANVSPVVTSPAGATIFVGETYTSSATFSDPGTDSWTATADYGDGTGTQSVGLSGQTASLQHRFSTAGTFTVTLSVIDDDGGVGTSTATVVVQSTTQAVAALSAAVQQLLDAGRINGRTAASLQASLRGATRQLELGHPLLARLDLAAFIIQVEIGDLFNRIPGSDAKALAAFARRVSRSI